MLAGEACQCFLYLLGHVLFAHLNLLLLLGAAVAIFVGTLAIGSALLVVAVVLSVLTVGTLLVALLAIVVAILLGLVGSIVHIDTFAANAVTLFALSAGLCLPVLSGSPLLVVAFAAALLLRLLFGSCSRVNGTEINGAEHLGTSNFNLGVEFEHTVFLLANGFGALFALYFGVFGSALVHVLGVGSSLVVGMCRHCFLGLSLLGRGCGGVCSSGCVSLGLIYAFSRSFWSLGFCVVGRLCVALCLGGFGIEVDVAHNVWPLYFGHHRFNHGFLGLARFGRAFLFLAVLHTFLSLVAQSLVGAEGILK